MKFKETNFFKSINDFGKNSDQILFYILCSIPKPRKKNLNNKILLFLLAKYDSSLEVSEFLGLSKRHVMNFKRQNLEKIEELRKMLLREGQ